jgi:hypothetical protein
MNREDRRRAIVLAAGAIGFIGAGVLVGVWLGERLNPTPETTVWGESSEAIAYRPSPDDSVPFVERMTRLRNELPYRSSWTDDDAVFALGLVERDLSEAMGVGPDAPDGAKRRAAEAIAETTFAILITSHAMGAGVEMSPEARRDAEALLLAYLEHPNAYLRRLGVGAMFDSRMIEQDLVYRWVNEIAAGDPDKETREFAAFELNYFDTSVDDAGRAGDGASEGEGEGDS